MKRYQLAEKVSILGIWLNIFLLVIKLIIGYISKNQAMIADGFNSAGDIFASLMTYIGNRISSQPQDKEHPYGHGKAEYIFSMIISFSFFFVSFIILRDSVYSLFDTQRFTYSNFLLGVALITIVIKLILFIYTNKIGKKYHNLLVIANSEDHRNDIFITLSVLISILAGEYGLYWVDPTVGMGIAIWIAYTGIRIFLHAFNVLMDKDINDIFRKIIVNNIQNVPGVKRIDSIIAKPIGNKFILIIKISVDASISVNEGHIIASDVKEKLKQHQKIADVIVHVNPI